jgi:uncharacterized protein (TIGR03382 family)
VGIADMSKKLPGATVQVSGVGSTTARDGDAYWSFDLSPGTYTVIASADGYQTNSRTCSVGPGAETWCSVGLLPEDPVNDPGNDPGNNPGQDPPDATGIIFGFVVELSDPVDVDLSDNTRVPHAMVQSDCGATTTADSYGYFEFEVDAGTRILTASSPDYDYGSAVCTVSEGGSAECYVPVISIAADPTDLDDPHDVEDEPGDIVGGCSTTPGTANIAPLFLFGLLVLKRRRG